MLLAMLCHAKLQHQSIISPGWSATGGRRFIKIPHMPVILQIKDWTIIRAVMALQQTFAMLGLQRYISKDVSCRRSS